MLVWLIFGMVVVMVVVMVCGGESFDFADVGGAGGDECRTDRCSREGRT